MNVRLVSNITKNGNQYTLVNVKIAVDNDEVGKQVTAAKNIDVIYSNVSSLFSAIQDATVDLVSSGFAG